MKPAWPASLLGAGRIVPQVDRVPACQQLGLPRDGTPRILGWAAEFPVTLQQRWKASGADLPKESRCAINRA